MNRLRANAQPIGGTAIPTSSAAGGPQKGQSLALVGGPGMDASTGLLLHHSASHAQSRPLPQPSKNSSNGCAVGGAGFIVDIRGLRISLAYEPGGQPT